MVDAARRIASPRRLGSADFAAILKSPKRARSPHFSLFWRLADAAGLGTVASKKLAGNSVRRNRVKRHAREAFRLCCADSQDKAANCIEVVLRVSADIRTLARSEQFAEIAALFARCGANGRQERT